MLFSFDHDMTVLRGNYNLTVYRYYEGQLTPISEVDFENNEDSPQIRVTEAAEQVHSKNPAWFRNCLKNYIFWEQRDFIIVWWTTFSINSSIYSWNKFFHKYFPLPAFHSACGSVYHTSATPTFSFVVCGCGFICFYHTFILF